MGLRVQTKADIREAMASMGINPQKKFGQNFLIDGNLMRRLVESAELMSDDGVLEVGVGTGGLTDLLVEAAGRVAAVEIDRALAEFVRKRFTELTTFQLIEGDVLRDKNHLADKVVVGVQQLAAATAGRTMLVANLPYSVATPLLINLLHELPQVSRFCFTVQRDVAEKMVAPPRTKAYGPLGIILQAYTTIKKVAQLPASVFWPQPTIESSMLRLDLKVGSASDSDSLAHMSRLVRSAFLHRRKTLRYSLKRRLDEANQAELEESFDLTRRPEELSVDEWIALARQIR